ncbi:MAG: pirin family protein [Betaproteobacteria bacterium]
MPVEQQLRPRVKDIGGGFMVRRLLPTLHTPSVGPFVFFDHFGPTTTKPDDNHDVRPHPHIGLSTVTYLFEGAMLHRDSLGSVQRIEPRALNWMTAGRGIVHSERAPPDLRGTTYGIHGLQLWAALPKAFEESEPAFHHMAADALPEWSQPGMRVRVLVGSAFGRESPVSTHSKTLYLDVTASEGSTLLLSPEPAVATFERAAYSTDHGIVVDGVDVPAFTMAVLTPGVESTIAAPRGARYVVIGGEALDGPRFLWWNFVSSSKERIEQAKGDWTEQRMGRIPGEHEWIPLP